MPYDIVELQFKYADVDSLVNLAQTCTQFQAHARRTFKKKYRNRIWLCPDSNLNIIPTFGQQATRLSINEYVGCYFSDEESAKLGKQLDKYCTNITSLKLPIDNGTLMSSPFIQKLMKNLRSLKLVLSCRKEINAKAVHDALASAKNLEYLNMEFCCNTIKCEQIIGLHNFPKLQTLKIKDISHLNGFYREFLLNFCPNLKHLEMSGPIEFPQLQAVRELPSLEYLHLHCTLSEYSALMITELKELPMLKALHVLTDITEDYMKDIFRLPSITSLALTINCPLMTLQTFLDWIRSHEKDLANLVEINLPRFQDYDKTVLLEEYLNTFPKLKSTIWNFQY